MMGLKKKSQHPWWHKFFIVGPIYSKGYLISYCSACKKPQIMELPIKEPQWLDQERPRDFYLIPLELGFAHVSKDEFERIKLEETPLDTALLKDIIHVREVL